MNDQATPATTHPSLLLRLRDPRDAAAWQLFVDTYAPLVYRYCRRLGLQDADAADVGQEVLVQVAGSIARFDYQPDRGRFRNWLGVVVRHRVARFKDRQRHPGRPADDAGPALSEAEAPEADSEWTAEFNAHVLQVALDRVRPNFDAHNWRAFEAVWLENRPVEEVARETGLRASAVYVAKSRILTRLREEVLLLAEDAPHLVR